MKYPKEDLITYRIKRARESFNSAKLLAENGFHLESISRLYYACFYMVLALLLKENLVTNSHTGARRLLGLHFIKTGKITVENGKLFSLLFDQRMKSDYEDFIKLPTGQTALLINNVDQFIKNIEALDYLFNDVHSTYH